MATLKELQARLREQEAKASGQGNFTKKSTDNQLYKHWDMPVGATATVRFLPDSNNTNPYFWAERQMIPITFNGIKNDPNSQPVTVKVPCVEMYNVFGMNMVCPITPELRQWYKSKDEASAEMASKFWKKADFIFQGFVRENPVKEDASPENPIRRFTFKKQIMPVIKAGLTDPQLIDLPTDYNNGLDFRIAKTQNGKWADYGSSNWARRESALTEFEQNAISQYGLFNLQDFLPKVPGETELKVIREMFEASIDGKLYDPEKWGQYYKPYGVTFNVGNQRIEADAATVVPASITDDDIPAWEDASANQPVVQVVTPKPVATSNGSDILARIKARQQNKA